MTPRSSFSFLKSFVFSVLWFGLLWRSVTAQDDGVNLGGGVITRTNVQSWADLSQDVGEMENLVAQEQIEAALGLYRNGKHSAISPGFLRSLSSLPDAMTSSNPKTPNFLFSLYGQADRTLNLAFDVGKLNYINTQVEEVFVSEDAALGPLAVQVLNMWMYGTHLLYNGVYECQQRSLADDTSLFDVGTAGWDEFIALWIGAGQQAGSNRGDSLYSLTQRLGTEFGISNPEAPTNTRLKLFYQEALQMMTTGSLPCSRENPNTANRLWQLVVNAVAEMSKPLFQGLISNMLNNNATAVDVYAKALIPQMSKCRPSLYKQWHEALILGNFQPNPTFVNTLLATIPELTYCFGYACDELGDSKIAECKEFDVFRPTLSGYVPRSEIGNVAAADLDVLQIEVLSELKANVFAEMMYMNGANIARYRQQSLGGSNDPLDYVSLHDIAVSSERSSAQPYFDIYVGYHNEKDYADIAIREALSGKSKWLATDQVATLVATTASYQILFLEAISKMRIAVNQCVNAEADVGVNPALNPIDEAAALLIGSMEGDRLGGSSDLEDGRLVYNIANRHAFQFNTINRQQYAKSVATIEDLLFAARAEYDALDCENLELSTESIIRWSMVGIVQGVIQLGAQNDNLSEFSTSKGLARMEALSLAILPLIKNKNANLATSIEQNTIYEQGTDVVPSGAQELGRLMGEGFTESLLLPCNNLGSIQDVDPCDGVQCSNCNNGKTASGATFPRVGTFVAMLGAVAWWVVAV